MDLKRRWYLYEIRPFCMGSEDMDLACPRPSQLKPETESEENTHGTTSSHKRKRTYSHCHQEGHTKTKKGKLTCPMLVAQSIVLLWFTCMCILEVLCCTSLHRLAPGKKHGQNGECLVFALVTVLFETASLALMIVHNKQQCRPDIIEGNYL